MCPILGDQGAERLADGRLIECSDAKFDCPNAMNLQLVEGRWWFEYMGAITLHASNVTLERSYTLAQPSSFDFDGKTIGIANKTVHTVRSMRQQDSPHGPQHVSTR